jgi:hypothetical protein
MRQTFKKGFFDITLLFIIIVIALAVVFTTGFKSKEPQGTAIFAPEVLPEEQERRSLQLGTLKFKECLDSAAVTMQLDITGSMLQAMGDLRNAVLTFTDSLSDNSVIGIQAYNSINPRQEIIPVSYYKDVRSQIRPAVESLRAQGSTPIYDALNFSREVLERSLPNYPDRKFSFIFFSDGNPNVGPSDPVSIGQAAERIKNLGVTVYSIGLGDINPEIIRVIASSPDKALLTADSRDLERLYSEIRIKLCE